MLQTLAYGFCIVYMSVDSKHNINTFVINSNQIHMMLMVNKYNRYYNNVMQFWFCLLHPVLAHNH